MIPICAGMYCSNKSNQRNLPTIHVFLKQFLDDVKFLYHNPFCFGDSSFALGDMGIYVCDAPMRSALKCIKAHSGYYSCERCIVCGVYDKQMRHVCLTDLSCRPRTNNSFLLQHDKNHHLGSSVLAETGVEMVTGFLLNYMHVSCLGVMKRLMEGWKRSKRGYV